MQLRQFRPLFGTTTYDLGDHLTVRHDSLLRGSEATYDLGRISATPSRIRYVPLGPMIVAALFAIFAGYGVSEGWLTGKTGAPSGFFMVAGCSALFGWIAWKKYRNVLVFNDKFTNEPAFAIWRSIPSVEKVDQFVVALAESCTRLRAPMGSSRAEAIDFYSRVLQQLLEAGVLVDAEYQAALNRLQSSSSTAAVLTLVPGEA